MPILVLCTRCSAKLNAPDTAAGKKVKCPKAGCGEVILVPEPVSEDFEVVDDDQEPEPPAKKSVSQTTKKRRDDDENDEDNRPRSNRRQDDDEEDEERPRSKRRKVDDDEEEEERPKSKRRRDDDDEEEERPKSKRRRDDDDEEEERPKKRRSSRDTDDDDDDEPDYRPGRCPNCSSRRWTKVFYTFWGGIIGPAIFSQVRCKKCGTNFSRKSGKPIGFTQHLMLTLVVFGIAGIIVFIGLIGEAMGGK